ncbi:MAG: hypothetical protein EOM87_04395 [Clostridia bacterium]|nr:hypothetical protein [Clostridia bacterium]
MKESNHTNWTNTHRLWSNIKIKVAGNTLDNTDIISDYGIWFIDDDSNYYRMLDMNTTTHTNMAAIQGTSGFQVFPIKLRHNSSNTSSGFSMPRAYQSESQSNNNTYSWGLHNTLHMGMHITATDPDTCVINTTWVIREAGS